MEDFNLRAKEILTIFPSVTDFETAIEFYLEIGFELDWKSDSMAVLRKDQCKFLLQNSSNNWIEGNFMMVLEVENLDHWWRHLEGLNLPEKYPSVRLRAPEDYP